MASTSYVAHEELLEYGGIHDGNDAVVQQAIKAASRAIDKRCRRRFYRDEATSTRLFHAVSSSTVFIDDASSDITVGIDQNGVGTPVALVSTEWLSEPIGGIGPNGEPGWPITKLTSLGARYFIYENRRPLVHVTARWGWLAVPDDIKQACLLLAHRLYKRRDSPHGIGGFGDLGAVRVLANEPDLAGLIDPYRRHSVLVA